ncbi:hypothetical protein DFJ58DRAFT_379108 [Suillus subalutaceus]|uniref:uncharacterized protein n=1 Tax=Suillus subalutaceus TaxID=48586 RepID=UPI001B8816B5|nr:uncharacterized protein DFJ58DRAFT_379108 [Suillus subalutaceus]KAG1854423.1 hypothetical protein DFJ58DRAFT_379108 [Suillus subalutaceus]
MDSAGFFRGDTMMEVFAVLANSGNNDKKVRDAVILYIARKKQKGRSEQQIQDKLLQLEEKFKHIEMWHSAFRDARALYQLPRSKHIPPPKPVPSPLKLPASPSCSSSTPSSRDGPPLRSQDLPYVLPTFSWQGESLESRVHSAPSSPGQIVSSDVLSLLSQYGDSEGDNEITAFLSRLEQS